tara:strand:+ start:986 stop:1414 length:429 start_codon:yes stop_codon:yes gene_type:complete
MFFISHRGNLSGPNEKFENKIDYVQKALDKGYEVEVDVRFDNDKFFLGHDFNQSEVNKNFLLNKKIWCHAKTKEALSALEKIKAHYFWHQEDDYTITSRGFVWTYPGKSLLTNSICVLPEVANYNEINCLGICSDYIERYKR